MSPFGVIWRRTVSRAFHRLSTAVALAAFLIAAAAAFAVFLSRGEGQPVTLPVLWAQSFAWVLPFVATYFAMDEFASERQSGRLELMLAAPVRERDLVFGKYAGALAMVAFVGLIALGSALAALTFFAPDALTGTRLVDFIPGLVALGLQAALWTAVALCCSTVFSGGASAGAVALLLTVLLPRGGWFAMMGLSDLGASAFGEMPLDAQVADMASGLFSTAVAIGYLLVTAFVLFVTSKRLVLMRFGGGGGRALKGSTLAAMALAAVVAAMGGLLAARLDVRLELQPSSATVEFSSRTRSVLSETPGEIAVNVFLSRRDPRFRPVCRFLRALASESAALGGARFRIAYVDPKWDLAAAERLVREGASVGSVSFRRAHRSVTVTLVDGFSERAFASALHRLTISPQRRNVYWTAGHGEYAFDDYGTWGMSDIARELTHEGFVNRRLDLAAGGLSFVSDGALVIVAGAKRDFSRAEIELLDGYLRKGGRLLLLQNSGDATALASLLPQWGIRTAAFQAGRTRTLSGNDVIVDDFASHPATATLGGSRIVMERPVGYASSAAAESGVGADRIEYTPLASVGGTALAAAVERGAGLGKDLSIRPTRIVCIGDGTFAVNGFLASRANANRDFLLNCVAYLAGTESAGGDGREAGCFTSGLDRHAARRFVRVSVGWVPLALAAVLWLVIFIRRRD